MPGARTTKKPATTAEKRERRWFNYPRAGKGKVHRWVPSWKFVLLSFTTLFIAGVAFVITAYVLTEIPEPDDFTQAETTTFYYSDGETVMGTLAAQNREIIDFDTLPEHVGQAVVASEDRTFWDNQGISITGMGRAFINNVQGGSQQGGSTITQQYAERYYLGDTTDYVGKFKEALLAVKLSQAQDKDEILGNYLNTIYFGRGSYGIQTAAQSYFGVDAADLSVEQAAVLAGILPAPNAWDPAVNQAQAESRWNRVLNLMVEDEYITESERSAMEFPEVIEYNRTNTFGGTQGYLLEMAKSEVQQHTAMSDEELETRGLTIITTIDPAMQDQIVETAEDLPEDAPENLRVGMISIENGTGAIKAVYGGHDYLEISRNAATQDRAQAGSTFKTFTLIAALENGHYLDERFNGNNEREFDGYDRPVTNFGGTSFGNVSLATATENSVNTAYVELNLEVGPDQTEEAAIRAGIPEDTPGLNDLISNVLGTASPRAVDMASAYSTIASGGAYFTPHVVGEVQDSRGNVIYSGGASLPQQVFDADVMADTTYALERVVTNGTGTAAQLPNQPAAGKTGTQQDVRSASFVGFTPYYSTSVVLYAPGEGGTEESIEPFGGYSTITGGTVPAELWGTYMTAVHEGLETGEFPERANVNVPERTPEPTQEPTEEPTPDPTEEPEPEPTETQPERVTVPSGLVGQSEAAARQSLANVGLGASVRQEESDQAPGVVLRVEPDGGTSVAPGSTIVLVVSSGPEDPDPEPDPDPTTDPPGDDGDDDGGLLDDIIDGITNPEDP